MFVACGVFGYLLLGLLDDAFEPESPAHASGVQQFHRTPPLQLALMGGGAIAGIAFIIWRGLRRGTRRIQPEWPSGTNRFHMPPEEGAPVDDPFSGPVHVVVVQIAFASARRESLVERIARFAVTDDDAVRALPILMDALRQIDADWTHTFVASGQSSSGAPAREAFFEEVGLARSGAVRGEQSSLRGGPSGTCALATVVLAARAKLPAVPDPSDHSRVAAFLESIASMDANDIAEFELVWAPPHRGGMKTELLELVAPRLVAVR